MANQTDFIVKYGIVVENTATISTTNNLVTTNIARTTAKPTLDLNFTRSSSLDPRINFTRSSAATYIDASGRMQVVGNNVPRFDYDPSTGQKRGLLLETSSSNLIPNSLNVVQSSMFAASPNTFVISNDITPLNTAGEVFKSVRDASTGDNNVGYFYSTVLSTATVYVCSAWIWIPSNTPPFTTLTMTFEGQGSTPVVSANTATTNQWQRIYSTGTNSTNTTTGIVNCIRMVGGTTGSYFYSTCWQLETNSGRGFPSSYIPTSTTTVTRSQEAVTITGAAFSNIYNQGQGTLYAESYMPGPRLAGGSFTAALYNSASDYIGVQYVASTGQYNGTTYLLKNGIQYTSGITSTNTFNQIRKSATTFDNSTIVSAGDGQLLVHTGTYSGPPLVSQLSIGSRAGNGTDFPFLGSIRRITYWPQKMTNAQLQLLTVKE